MCTHNTPTHMYEHRCTDCDEIQLCSEGQNRGGDTTQLDPSVRSDPANVLSQCKTKMLPVEPERGERKGVCVSVSLYLY